MRVMLIGLASALFVAASPAAAFQGPFTRAELVGYLKQNVPYWADPGYDAACEKAAASVRARGISFAYDGEFDPELHQAGACPPVLHAMRQAMRGAAPGAQSAGGGAKASPSSAQAARVPAATRPAPAQAGTARPGRYRIFSYGNVMTPLLLGYVDLKGNGTYTVLDRGARPTASGRYAFSGGGVDWKSGLYASSYKRSAFEVRRGGKDHVLKLNRVTIAVHSTDVR